MPALSLTLPQNFHDDLHALASAAERAPEELILEALEHYLTVKKWQANELELALEEADAGGFAPDAEAREVLRSYHE